MNDQGGNEIFLLKEDEGLVWFDYLEYPKVQPYKD